MDLVVRTPPVRRARSRAASAENALVETIQLLPVLDALQVLLSGGVFRLELQVRLNRFVLTVEVGKVLDGARCVVRGRCLEEASNRDTHRNKILDDVHVWMTPRYEIEHERKEKKTPQ